VRLELVRAPISGDTVQALEQLLTEAREGAYIGFVIGLIRPRRRYSVHCVGEACVFPSWARGILAVADDELAAMIAGEERDTNF
jgi:hypothetical protein